MQRSVVDKRNILSAALCIFIGGLVTSVPALKTGWIGWAVISGLMVGSGLALAYLSLQWESKTKVNLAIGGMAGVTAAVGTAIALDAMQGSLTF